MTLTGAREMLTEGAPGSSLRVAEPPDSVRAPASPDAPPAALASPPAEPAAPTNRDRCRRLLAMERLATSEQAAEGLRLWYGESELRRLNCSAGELSMRLACDIAEIDERLSAAVNQILHHPEFQRLESSWRGLAWLHASAMELNDEAKSLEDGSAVPPLVKIKVLNVTKRELARDLGDAIEFDQSQFFYKVYEDEYGHPGGEPYGVLIGDFDFSKHPDDVFMLGRVAEVAAAAHCPFVSSAAPDLLGLEDYTDLQRHPNLAKLARSAESIGWRSFRESEESRYVGLVLPRVLMRLPYAHDGTRADGFRFDEDLSRTGGGEPYLWGRSVYAFAGVVSRAFSRSGWLADIRGVRQDESGGGLVENLPVHRFGTDRDAFKFSTNVAITDAQERELAELGVISLCPCHGTDLSAFYSVPSCQKAKTYDGASATTNARMSAMLHYILCASRFAHYLKVIARDKTGRFASAEEMEAFLHDWLVDYVTEDDAADARTKARRPLRAARAKIRAKPDRPGDYDCEIHLQPHHQLDDLLGTIRLVSSMEQAART